MYIQVPNPGQDSGECFPWPIRETLSRKHLHPLPPTKEFENSTYRIIIRISPGIKSYILLLPMSGENEDTRILFHSRIHIPRKLQLIHIGSSSIAKTLTTIHCSSEATMRGRFAKEFQHTGMANSSKIQSSH